MAIPPPSPPSPTSGPLRATPARAIRTGPWSPPAARTDVIPGRVRAFLAALSVAGLAVGLAACAPEKPEPPATGVLLEQRDFAALPGWQDDALAEAMPAFLKSCDRLARQPAERAV